MSDLKLETQAMANRIMSSDFGGPTVMITPPLDENYWTYRVKIPNTRNAIVAFPKFTTIGIGFAKEKDWNTNLPWTFAAENIFDHIAHNAPKKGSREVCIRAIEMIQEAIRSFTE